MGWSGEFVGCVSNRAGRVRSRGEGPAPCWSQPTGAIPMPQYMLSVHASDDDVPPAPEVMQEMFQAVEKFNATVQAEGIWVFAGGLHQADTATVVRAHEGDVTTTDG